LGVVERSWDAGVGAGTDTARRELGQTVNSLKKADVLLPPETRGGGGRGRKDDLTGWGYLRYQTAA